MFSIFKKESNCSNKDKSEPSLKRALSKVIPLCFLAFLIAGLICSVANDMYAFVKDDKEILLTFDSGCSLKEVSKILANHGVVNNPDIFRFYVKLKDKEDLLESFIGDIKLNSSMSYREILSEFSQIV